MTQNDNMLLATIVTIIFTVTFAGIGAKVMVFAANAIGSDPSLFAVAERSFS